MTDLSPVNLIILLSLLGLLPFFLMMVTSYVKIVVVFSLIKNALGVQQVPPAMVLNGLAIVLTIFIMGPVGLEMGEIVESSGINLDASLSKPQEFSHLLTTAAPPLERFLKRNTDVRVSTAMKSTAKRLWPQKYHHLLDDDGFLLMLPSFVLTELTEAFQIGFLLYLPFIVIDLIISNILLAMGMMMVSPMTISLPFKLLLFVTLDGWLKISQGLMYGYG
ncbi:MAG: type III secretion system export apparatus subunit SctR [Zoogloeaceae bacterium]|jgi:type III secretion protein R|nr:type III secretion system export apparatus subunit SctR [Zoogloeaceae bacterium]